MTEEYNYDDYDEDGNDKGDFSSEEESMTIDGVEEKPFANLNYKSDSQKTVEDLNIKRNKRHKILEEKADANLSNKKKLEIKATTEEVLLKPGNFVRKYMKYMSTQYDGYQDWNLAAAYELLSIISDKKLVLKTAQEYIYPNIWIFGLGTSTISRKSTGMKKAKKILEKLKLKVNKLSDSFTPERFIEDMSENSHAYFMKDEAAGFLASLQKSYMSEMRDLFMDLYDCGDYSRSLRTSKSKNDDKKANFNVVDTYLNMCMMTTPENFKEYATTLDVLSGWFMRYLFLYPTYKKNWMGIREENEQDIVGFNELVKFLKERSEQVSNTKQINMHMTKEAWDFFNKWQESRESSIRETDDKVSSSIFGRLQMYALKLAMIYELGKEEFVMTPIPVPEPVVVPGGLKFKPKSGPLEYTSIIEIDTITEACNMIDDVFLPNARMVVAMIEEDEGMKIVNKVLDIIKKNDVIKKSHLLQLSHMTADKVNRAIEDLKQRGLITEEITDTGTFYEYPFDANGKLKA